MNYYKQKFETLFTGEITNDLAKRIISCCTYFETKDQNPLALNTPLLGVTPIYFTSMDVTMLFHTVGVEESDIARITAESPYTQDSWVVSNDPYNNLIIFLVYKLYTSKNINEKTRHEAQMSLLKLLHYKYFTSLVGNSYPYGADEAVMSWVVNNLNKKFGLAKYESWRAVIEERCIYLLSSESNHGNTLKLYSDDEGIVYVLSDTQSNLRQKIVRINVLYYQAKEDREAIGSYNTLDSIDGVKVISSTVEVFDNMIQGMQLQTQSPSRLLDMELIDVIATKYKEISSELFRLLLNSVCDLSATQIANPRFKHVVQVTNPKTQVKEDIIISVNDIISEFIQKTYRYCINSKDVNMSSRKAILVKSINIYTSSQLVDENIIKIKRSIIHMVTTIGISKRPATISALSLCLIIYLLIRSFDYIK